MNDLKALQFDEVKEQIAAFARFSLGKAWIREAQPSFDELWIKREGQRTSEAMELLIRYGSVPLPGLYDIRQSLEDAKRGKALRPFECNRIAKQGHGVKAVQTYMKEATIETPYLDDLCFAFQDVSALCKEIERCINENDEVMDRASAKLAHLRKSIRLCEGDITKEVQHFIASNAAKLMDTITTTRNNRVCVLVKAGEKNSVRGFIHGESASGQTAYIEPESLLALNNKLTSLKGQEQEEIERILSELSQRIRQEAYALESNQETFALLDAYFAKAEYAKANDACMAKTEAHGDHLYLKQARHPLIDPKLAVANTYEIKAPYRCLLITGSNTGGKTVTLKTIALAACLAQSAMPILAQEAVLPLFSDIFVDIGDDQSIQESLSTFSAHVSKLAYILDHATAESLVLLDELGSGTDPREGESLAVAILDELQQMHAFVLATTHYSALKSYAKQQSDVLVSGVEFDVAAMKPTYRYLEGISGASNAFAIARRYRLKESVLIKAEEMRQAQRTHQDALMEKLEQELHQAMCERDQLREQLAQAEQLKQELQMQKERLRKEADKQLNTLKEEYRSRMEETLQEGEAIIEELKALDHEVKPHVVEEIAYRFHSLNEEKSPEESIPTQELAIGDRVAIAGMNAHGEIIEMHKDKVIVLVNGVRMNTKKSELSLMSKPSKQKKSREKGYGIQRSTTHFSMELNVIGMQVAEAIPMIDKYLDNAILAKLSTVRIIHGNGTGALRKGVHNYLKRDSKVDAYRLGGMGEGGSGATVVTLKKRGKAHG